MLPAGNLFCLLQEIREIREFNSRWRENKEAVVHVIQTFAALSCVLCRKFGLLLETLGCAGWLYVLVWHCNVVGSAVDGFSLWQIC